MIVATDHHNDLFFTKNSLKSKAKGYIRKNSEIYIGNLTYWLKNDIPTATNNEISIVFLQLMKEGFFFDKSGVVYPPEKVNSKEIELIKIVENFELEEIDLEIFLAMEDLGKTANIKTTARKVVSINSNYEEGYVKYKIGVLFLKKFILAKMSKDYPQYLVVNMSILDGEIE